MVNRQAFRNFARAVAVLTVLSGCGQKWHTVEGTVTLDGKPVDQASVMFIPKAGGTPSSAATDASGQFRLLTTNKEGVAAGEYTVVISKNQMKGVLPGGVVGPKGTWYEWSTPERYGSPETSGLTATVPQANYDFNLTTK